jgi:DNA-binding transcriptional ArsR family regulator
MKPANNAEDIPLYGSAGFPFNWERLGTPPLPKTADEIAELLTNGLVREDELITQTGLSQSVLRRWLDVLRSAGFSVFDHEEDGYVLISAFAPE